MPRDPADPVSDPFPKGVARPARRALAHAGVQTMRDLERFSRAELMQLHGFGPRAFEALDPEMDRLGLRFRD